MAYTETKILPSMLKKVQIARRYMITKLGWDDDIWYDFLFQKTGKKSTKELSQRAGIHFIGDLTRAGFVDDYLKNKPKTIRKNSLGSTIKALWIEMGNMGALRNKSSHGLDFFIYRVIGRVDDANNISQDEAQEVHAQLRKWYNRVKAKKEYPNEQT